jgi:hypothetical protein
MGAIFPRFPSLMLIPLRYAISRGCPRRRLLLVGGERGEGERGGGEGERGGGEGERGGGGKDKLFFFLEECLQTVFLPFA